jgi:Vacuolar ATP synthase subunit S1 (ATP6S1)
MILLQVTVRYKFPNLISGYWIISEVEVQPSTGSAVTLTLANNITVPRNFSYHCKAFNTTFRNGANSLTFIELQVCTFIWTKTKLWKSTFFCTCINHDKFQVQPYNFKKRFNDAYDCSHFFTIPIWSGIFTTTILAIILSCGLCMILDIKTNDRFDDPKGKTITVTASD